MTMTRMILMNEKDLREYRTKLDFVQGYVIPHVGEPEKYPCLAVTEFCDDLVSQPQWEHLYIYSHQIDDLKVIYDKLDADGVKQIAHAQKVANAKAACWRSTIRDAQPDKEMGPDDSDWDKFWDSVGDVSDRPETSGANTARQLEWSEYEATRLAAIELGKTDFTAAVKRTKIFFDRWPKSTYRELLIFLMRDLQRKAHPGMNTSSSSDDHTHDYYPPHARGTTSESENQTTSEPRSRISRRTSTTKEVNFVNED
jgi:hypothetical protein